MELIWCAHVIVDLCGSDGQLQVDRFLPSSHPSAIYLAARTLHPARGGFLESEGGDSPSMSAVGASLCAEVGPSLRGDT